jgi:Tfp pilus assembly protein PilX
MMQHRPSGAMRPITRRARDGYALMVVLLIMLVAGVVAMHAAILGMNTSLSQGSSDRASRLDDAALSGIEEVRARLNARLDSIPAIGYGTIEDGVPVPGLPGARRWTYAGRRGNTNNQPTTGEYGVMAHIISRVADVSGSQSIRRAEVYQESFARYADFTDQSRRADGAALYWAQGSVLAGPVHSNDTIRVWSGTPWPQATFRAEVTTAMVVEGQPAAVFEKGPPQEGVARIELPSTAEMNLLKTTAAGAGYSFTPAIVTGDSATVTLRIEFLAIDADGDGNTTGPLDGYFRVYRMNDTSRGPGYVGAELPVPPSIQVSGAPFTPLDSMLFSRNCGPTTIAPVHGVNREVTSDANVLFSIPLAGSGSDDYRTRMTPRQNAFDDASTRCFLGGDERLNGGVFRATDGAGAWLPRTTGTLPASIAGRADAAYLWPLSPQLNPRFRGVIFVEGNVGVSGVMRGRVTVAARQNIVVLHNLEHAQNPGSASGCFPDDDVLGLYAGQYIFTADNTLITPQWRRDDSSMATDWIWPRKDFDPDTRRPELTLHASMLALMSVAAERPSPPPMLPATQWVNRGITRTVGGRVQGRAGQGGTFSNIGTLHGSIGDITFNTCALRFPPPFFPTTGRWTLAQFFEINPQNFDPTVWFSRP